MLRKKTLRDIKYNKSQFFTIFLMVFLGVFVFAGVHAYMDGMQVSADNYYEKNNLQDLWLSGLNFSKDDLKQVKELDNIKDAERALTLTTTLDNYDDITIEANFIESNNISKMYVVDGEGFDKEKSGLWFDSYLAKTLNLKVGDEITLTYQKYKIKEKIVGLINTPDHVYAVKDESEIFPNHKDFGYVYMSINEFPKDYIYDNLKQKMMETNPMLAQSYVPWQYMDKTFRPEIGLKMGTIFPELVSPYTPCQSMRTNEFLETTNQIGEGCNNGR